MRYSFQLQVMAVFVLVFNSLLPLSVSAGEELSPGIFDVPIVLTEPLEKRREEFRKDFIEAQTRLRAFASKHGWEGLTSEPLVRQIEIYDTKNGFDKRMRELCSVDGGTAIPITFSAGIEKDIFFAVSPEIYRANYADGREHDAYIKLMTHELAHRLHVRICGGDEDKMGPMWFWEGFAVYAADQLNENPPELSNTEIWSIVDARERGSYKKYNVVFRHFLKDTPLRDYVKRAGEPKFRDWLERRP
ncbi:MAG: hypothetical protein IPM23_05300 [Candidatus Melainabacteria bacterium]|nr:hypothetical protein [Candidatus Melainabacteria bacterium]